MAVTHAVLNYDRQTHTSCTRTTGVQHRSAISSSDKLQAMTLVTAADVATTGTLSAGTAYKITAIPGTRYGFAVESNILTVTTASDASNTHCVRLTLPQVTGAEFYDVFVSTDAHPKFVARITEANRAAGCKVTAVGTVAADTGNPGKVTVQVPGTGTASSAAPYTINNAYYLPATVTPINAAGYQRAFIIVSLSLTDFTVTNPSVSLTLWGTNQVTGDYSYLSAISPTFLGTAPQPLQQSFEVDVYGNTGIFVLVESISGTGAAISVQVELAE